MATTLGGVFRRTGDLSRTFRSYPMASSIQYDTRVKDASETVLFLFDFSRFPEVKAGETLSTPVVDAVSGLTIGTPAVTTAIQDTIPAGKAVQVTISGGTANTTYSGIECRCTTSGGSVRVVKGSLVVE